MKPTEYTCYGCKGGDGEPLRVLMFGSLKSCPSCGRPFKPKAKTPCVGCKSHTAVRGGLCSSCLERNNHG